MSQPQSMYVPSHFRVDDSDEIARFITANGFGQLISLVDGNLFATHMPFLYDRERQCLLAHLARGNPQWRELESRQALVILPGPHGYVSPSWYHSPGVPTWNYQAVHITGVVRCLHDPETLADIVAALTAQYESTRDTPWVPDYQAKMLQGIVGLEIAIADIQCKYKLNQNRSAVDRHSVSQELDRAGNPALAMAMRSLD